MKHTVAAIAGFVLALAGLGCGDSDSSDQDAGSVDVAPAAVDRFWDEPRSDEPYFADGAYILDRSVAGVVSQLIIEGTAEDGTVAMGFDLDQHVSPDGEEASCGHGDVTGPDGKAGVDNQFAKVWDLIESLVGVQVRALLLEAINEGRFLLIVELSGVDDLVNDDDVTVTLMRGKHTPEVGAAGYLLPSQTYEIDTAFPTSVVEQAAIVNGVLEAGPVQVRVPIEIFDANFVLPLDQGQIRLTIDPVTGAFEGILGGTVHVGDTLDELLSTGAAAEASLVQPVMESNADMAKTDGKCERLSAAFGFRTTPGYIRRYPAE